MMTRLLCAALGAAWCALAAAQAVYESKDKSGPVFSDQPSSSGKTMDLPPPNVIQTPALPKQAPAKAAAAAYTSLAVTTPADGGTVNTNTGAFDVVVTVAPALRARAGDRIRLKLDGTLLPSAYSKGRIAVTTADWQAAAKSGVEQHTLQASIVDKTGASKYESAPVSFFARRAAVGERRGR